MKLIALTAAALLTATAATADTANDLTQCTVDRFIEDMGFTRAQVMANAEASAAVSRFEASIADLAATMVEKHEQGFSKETLYVFTMSQGIDDPAIQAIAACIMSEL